MSRGYNAYFSTCGFTKWLWWRRRNNKICTPSLCLLSYSIITSFVNDWQSGSWEEFWIHARHFNWDPRALYAHVHRLASTCISTKEGLEDIIGDVSDHVTRDAKWSSQISPERVLFNNVHSQRLRSMPFCQLQPGDWMSKGAKEGSRSRKEVFGEQVSVTSETSLRMKEFCQAGLQC